MPPFNPPPINTAVPGTVKTGRRKFVKKNCFKKSACFCFSGEEAAEGRAAAAAEDDLHQRPDPAAGAGVPEERVHQPAEEVGHRWPDLRQDLKITTALCQVRAGGESGPDRDADQDLVPKPAGQGQEDREGADGPAI